MRLTSFRVSKFRNVVDSTEIDVQTDVTCLVGKNESGKTTVLQGLLRLNPAHGEQFDESMHYPRWMRVADRRKGIIGAVEPIRASFFLDDEDAGAIEERFGEGVLSSRDMTVARLYDGETSWRLDLDEAAAVANIIRNSAGDDIKSVVDGAKTFEDLRDRISSPAGTEDDDDAVDFSGIRAAVEAAVGADAFEDAVIELLEEKLPTFFYFSNYEILPGRVDLSKLTGEEAPGSSAMQTARALLGLAGTEADALGEENYEERKAELEAVSSDLTRQVFDYWTQNPALRVVFDVDKETVASGNGQQAVARFLDIRVEDTRHHFTNNFGQRSSGFQWFFSFLAAFSEFQESDRPVIVLLDEPALGLHAKAQADFLKFINERLAPSCQVLYSTHSPFMVESGRLERVRIVEDKGPDTGATVSADALGTDRDSLFPLQAALGYDIAQNLFVSANNLVIEGTSDYTYIMVMSEHLRSLERTALAPAWSLLPVGGMQNVPTFVALLGGHLDVTVLIDSGTPGTQRITNMADKGFLASERIIMIGDVLDQANADIEDMFSPDEYLWLYNKAFDTDLKVADLPPGDRVIKRIAAHIGADFDHGRPAEMLLRHRDEFFAIVGDESLIRFEQLFAKVGDPANTLVLAGA